jgi:hypothetical protein
MARPPRREEAVVVAREFHCLALRADEFDCCEVKAVEGAHRDGKGLQCPSQDRRRQCEQPQAPDQRWRKSAECRAKPARTHAIPHLVLEKPAGNQRLLPKRLRGRSNNWASATELSR